MSDDMEMEPLPAEEPAAPGIFKDLLLPGLFLPLVLALGPWVVVLIKAGGGADPARLGLNLGMAIVLPFALAILRRVLRAGSPGAVSITWALTVIWLIVVLPLSFMVAVPPAEGKAISGVGRVVRFLQHGSGRAAPVDEEKLAAIRAQLEGSQPAAPAPTEATDAATEAEKPPLSRELVLQKLVGIVRLPGILSPAEKGKEGDGEIFVHEQADEESAPLGTIFADQADSGGHSCPWSEESTDNACLLVLDAPDVRALPVYEVKSDGWYKVAVDPRAEKLGWIQTDGQYSPLAMLVAAARPTYLTAIWDRKVSGEPGAEGALVANVPAGEVAYRADDSKRVDGVLWIHAEILSESCDDDADVLAEGWIRAHAPDGRLWVWFKPEC